MSLIPNGVLGMNGVVTDDTDFDDSVNLRVLVFGENGDLLVVTIGLALITALRNLKIQLCGYLPTGSVLCVT